MPKKLMIILCLCIASHAATIKHSTLGYSFVRLDKEMYHALEAGTSVVWTTAKGDVRPYGGTEVSIPVFIDSNDIDIEDKMEKGSGYGVALQVPLIVGLDIKGFYMQLMGGYNLSWLNNTVKKTTTATGQAPTVSKAKTQTISQGYIYGAGIGYNFDMNFSMGLRYLRGSMNNKVVKKSTSIAVRNQNYKTNYEKAMFLIGFVY